MTMVESGYRNLHFSRLQTENPLPREVNTAYITPVDKPNDWYDPQSFINPLLHSYRHNTNLKCQTLTFYPSVLFLMAMKLNYQISCSLGREVLRSGLGRFMWTN